MSSVASVSNQYQDAALTLLAFSRPLPVAVIQQAQDWQTRQQIAYAAILGRLREDFLALDDWVEQLNSYSNANFKELGGPYASVASRLYRNTRFQAQLAVVPGLGTVGRDLCYFLGFAKAFTLSADILEDSANLANQLGTA